MLQSGNLALPIPASPQWSTYEAGCVVLAVPENLGHCLRDIDLGSKWGVNPVWWCTTLACINSISGFSEFKLPSRALAPCNFSRAGGSSFGLCKQAGLSSRGESTHGLATQFW